MRKGSFEDKRFNNLLESNRRCAPPLGAGRSFDAPFAPKILFPAVVARQTDSCIIEQHEKNDRKDIVCYLHRFCGRQSKRADECLATIAGTHASADLAGGRS
jgi:hypothetical protein